MAMANAICRCSSCGCEFNVRTYRINRKEADAFEEWAEENIKECSTYKKARLTAERDANIDKAAEAATNRGWPELSGSPKQIRWAVILRDTAIKKEIDSITGGVAIGANASTSAFKQYLYNDLRLPVVKKTEKNQEATDDATMQMLKEWCAKNRPELVRLFELIQEYRKWGKLKSTYIDGYLTHVRPNRQEHHG